MIVARVNAGLARAREAIGGELRARSARGKRKPQAPVFQAPLLARTALPTTTSYTNYSLSYD